MHALWLGTARRCIGIVFVAFVLGTAGCKSTDDAASRDSQSSGDGGSSGSGTAGAVELSWSAPTTREDGTPLSYSQLDGFVIYSGTSSNSLSETARVDDRTVESYTVNGLESGTHYFAVSAYDVNGLEGSRSDSVSVTIQ